MMSLMIANDVFETPKTDLLLGSLFDGRRSIGSRNLGQRGDGFKRRSGVGSV
jgi:hypothetical protein